MGQGFESLLAHRVGVAQLVEHWVVVPGVEGSSPFTHLVPLIPAHDILLTSVLAAPVAMARNSSYGARGPLAQLAEQLTLNQRVRSSNLRRPITLGEDICESGEIGRRARLRI